VILACCIADGQASPAALRGSDASFVTPPSTKATSGVRSHYPKALDSAEETPEECLDASLARV
jgi:hypothetical protein